MSNQNIIALILITILVALLMLRVRSVKRNEERIDKTSIVVIFVALFSLTATRLQPTYLDVIAVYVILTMVNFFVLIYSIITDFKIRGPRRQLHLVQDVESDFILTNSMASETPYHQATVRSVEISTSGEYTVHDQQVPVIQPTEFQIPVVKLTTKHVIIQVLRPDLMELFLLVLALLVNWVIMARITGLDLFHPFMLMYWGIISFIFYTIRWSYTGPFQYAARMKVIEREMMKGKHVVDFKVIGMIFSFVLIVGGIILIVLE